MQHPHQTDGARAARLVRTVQAGILPFALSVTIMSYGCPLGIPARFPFDAVNIALLISYAVSVKRILGGAEFRLHRLGFSRPRIANARPGAMKSAFTVSLQVLIPGCLAIALWVLGTKPYVDAADNIVVTVTSRILPMYVLAATWGWLAHVKTPTWQYVAQDT